MNHSNYDNYNRAHISGELVGESVLSHEIYGEKFYKSAVRAVRLSGAYDTVPVLISERIMPKDWTAGKTVHAIGQFRSHNEIVDGRSRLKLYVFIRELLDEPADRNPNRIFLAGYVCKKPNYRTTPFSREIADLLIAANRAYNKCDYIPCIAWGRNARFVRDLNVGEWVTLEGRIQSREYEKQTPTGIELRTAYEVSITKIMAAEEETEFKSWEDEE